MADDPIPESSVGAIIQALPIERMIGAPLEAMIDAQINAGRRYVQFVREECIDSENRAVMVRFNYFEPQIDTDGAYMGSLTREMRIPLVAMVPHPIVAVQDATVDFEMEVSHAETLTDDRDAEGTLDATGVRKPSRTLMKGRVTHKTQQTRTTDTRAKYTIHTSVKREEPPESMMRVMELLTDAAARPMHRRKAPSQGGED